MSVRTRYNHLMTLTEKRSWTYSIAIEISHKKNIRVNPNLFSQHIDFHLGGLKGHPKIDLIEKWIKKYDFTYNRPVKNGSGSS